MKITEKYISMLLIFQKQEITGNIIYKKLAQKQKNKRNRSLLNKIAEDELKHYNIYKKFTQKEQNPNPWNIYFYTLLSSVFGLTFGLKLMEKNEMYAQMHYSNIKGIPEITSIIKDEEKHEIALIEMIDEKKLNYIGSIVLGLNDALVELTGALAGFAFAFRKPELVALTGLITGIAAALSMAASEYLSTKSEDNGRHAFTASIYTGITYILTVAVLILPFLLLKNIYVSLIIMLFSALIIIAAFNYYYSIVKDKIFIYRFTEMAALSLTVAGISFGMGFLIKIFLGIEI